MAITLNGTTGIASVDASVAAPSIRGTDGNTGVSYGADSIKFSTGGVERMAISNSGITGLETFIVDWKYVNKTDVFSEASIAAGGVSGAAISIAYTAASTSNRLLITATLMINTSSNARHGVIAYKDGSAFARGDAHPDSQNNLARMSASGYNEGMSYTMDSMPFQFIDTPADTSAHTYDFRIWNGKNGSNTVYLNRTSTNDNYAYLQGTGMSSISIIELKPQQS